MRITIDLPATTGAAVRRLAECHGMTVEELTALELVAQVWEFNWQRLESRNPLVPRSGGPVGPDLDPDEAAAIGRLSAAAVRAATRPRMQIALNRRAAAEAGLVGRLP